MKPDVSQRVMRFAAVGLLGLTVQVTVLHILVLELAWPTGWSALMAIEVALLHNLLWHERWTWRGHGRGGRERWRQWATFHAANGSLSLGLTPLVTVLLVGWGCPLVMGHLVAVGLVGVVNFWLADRWVFGGAGHAKPPGVAPACVSRGTIALAVAPPDGRAGETV